MNLSQILNLNESDVDDPFADPRGNLSSSDLVHLLDKLETQAVTLAARRDTIKYPVNFNNMLCDVTGETSAIVYDDLGVTSKPLDSGWVHIHHYDVSPGVMADPSLKWFVHGLQQMGVTHKTYLDIQNKIKNVRLQIKRMGR